MVGALVVKVADSDEERRRLGTEAAVLRLVAHPGVVRLACEEGAANGEGAAANGQDGPVPAGPDRLILHRVPGTPLSEVPPQPPELVAGWGAALATVLADLHALGVVHGAVGADHVIIDDQGRPVLCGFGSARRLTADDHGREASVDVSALAGVLLACLEPGEAALRRLLVRWAAGRQRSAPDPASLARSLVARVPEARVDTPAPAGPAQPAAAAGPASTGDRATAGERLRSAPAVIISAHPRLVAGALAAGIACAATVVVSLWPSGARSSGAGGQALPTAAPLPAYILSAAPGEDPVAVVGRWGCGPSRPAVLDLGSGVLWVFSGVPGGNERVRATFASRIPSASGLAVSSSGRGCDQLLVLRHGRPDLNVAVGGGGR